ncbi:MAG: flagellar motor switch protein FliN [Phycisphaerales bacterium]|nr:flagellar motor switch protein FliN [Phycisphaerales bacterium]
MADDSTNPQSAADAFDASVGFSQDEIDKLFAAQSAGSGTPAPASSAAGAQNPASAGGDDVNLSQDELDALLAGAGLTDAGPSNPAPPAPATAGPAKLDAYGRPFDEAAAAMAAAIEEEKQAAAAAAATKTASGKASAPAVPQGKPLDTGALPQFAPGILAEQTAPDGLDLLLDVNLRVKIELGRTRMLVEDVLRLDEGSVVELDRLAGDPVDIYANDRLVARGEILVLNDNFCVRVSEVITLDPHRVGAA